MKKSKGFWKYFTITILLLVGLVCAGILYMFFVGAPLFNFKYVSYNKNYVSSEYNVVENEVDTIKLQSGKFNVKILDSTSSSAYLKVHNGVFGFTTRQSSNFYLLENLEDGVLSFEVEEPHGLVAAGSSEIDLFLPAGKNLNLILSNNSSKTSLNITSEIQDLSYSTQSGNFEFAGGKIAGQINLSIGRARFNIAETVETNENEVNIKMTSGSFNCPTKDFDVVNLMSSTSGVVRVNKCNEIVGNNENSGGSINATEVGNANLVAGDTNINITNLISGMIEIYKTGKINIDKTLGRVNLHTKAGNITVKECGFELACTTDSGNIRVEKAVKVVNAETVSGNIYINYDFEGNVASVQEEGEEGNKTYSYSTINSYAEDKDNRRVIVKTERGTINCYGVENIDLLITGSGRANVYMENVLGSNVIQARNKGAVFVQVKEFKKNIMPNGWPHFRLTTQSNTGSVRVNFSQMEETDGYSQRERTVTDINMKGISSFINSLDVITEAGSLTILDSITAGIKK